MKGLPSDCFSHGKGAKPKIVYVYESKTVNGVTQTGTRVKQVEYYVGDQLIDRYYYNYNAAGNISEYGALGQKTYWNDYDELGQLRQQIHFDANGWPVSDYFYSYDQNGNLLTKKKSGTVNGTYSYDNAAWKDQLTGYNGNGTFAYDANGNPLSYYNGSQYTFTWKDGCRLATASALNGYLRMSYSYNADGIRVSKNVNDVRHEYYLDGSRIIKETWADQTLEFLYDENNSVYCIVYTGGDGAGRYYLIKNLQGDVTRILNNNLQTVAQYVYDPWGKLVYILDANGEPNSGISIANINPIRYRGYYFDMETGFYYLNARYYDPALGRFISPDTTDVLTVASMELTDKNLYAYCDNNPVMREDKGGQFWNIIVGAVIGGGLELAGQLLSGKSLSEVNWAKVGVSAVSGGLTAAVGPVAGCIVSGATDVAMDALDGNIHSVADAAESFVWGTAKAAVSYGVGTAVGKATKSLTSVEKVGRIGDGGYPGVKYSYDKGRGRAVRSIELHPNHNNHGIHLQGNKWNPKTGTRSGVFFRKTLWR